MKKLNEIVFYFSEFVNENPDLFASRDFFSVHENQNQEQVALCRMMKELSIKQDDNAHSL